MYAPGKRHTINTDNTHMFSMKSWILIILGIAFLLIVFTPPLREAVASLLKDIFGPLLELTDNVMQMMEFIN